MKKRYYVIFKGQVQGVGFRFTIMLKAKELNIGGSVKNLINGDVECYFEGEENSLKTMLRFIRSNPGFIHIDDYQIKEVAIQNDNDFIIIY